MSMEKQNAGLEETMEASPAAELSEEELDGVNGGLFIDASGTSKSKPWPKSKKKPAQASTLVYHSGKPPVATTLENHGDIGGDIELL